MKLCTAVQEGCGYKDTLRVHRYFAPLAKYFTVCITYQPPLIINMFLCMFSLLPPFHHQVLLMLQHNFQNENNLFPNGKQASNKWQYHEDILPT